METVQLQDEARLLDRLRSTHQLLMPFAFEKVTLYMAIQGANKAMTGTQIVELAFEALADYANRSGQTVQQMYSTMAILLSPLITELCRDNIWTLPDAKQAFKTKLTQLQWHPKRIERVLTTMYV